MTTCRSVRRPGRARSRGQAIVLVAITGVAMIAMTGLALDGGYLAGKYREAQNASDAGALAAARQIYDGLTTCTPTNFTTLENASNTEVRHNNATPGDVNGSSQFTCDYQQGFVPSGPTSGTGNGEYAHSALATVTAQVNVGLASITASLAADEASATGEERSPSSGGSTTSGQVDLANVNATVTTLGIPLSAQGALLCLQSSQTYPTTGTWSGSSACSPNTLGLVSSLLGALASITGSAGVNLSPQSTNSYIGTVSPYLPHTVASNALTSVGTSTLGTVVNASAANVISQVGSSATVLASDDFNLAGVSTGLLSLSVAASLVNIHAELDYNPTTGRVSAPAPTCTPGTITLGGTSYNVLPSCHISGLPASLVGVTLKDFSSSITTSGCPGTSCTEHGCFLDLSVVGSIADVCLGEFDLSAAGTLMATPSGGSGYSGSTSTLLDGVTVEAHTDSPSFFMTIDGWGTQHPTTTTSAAVDQVADESTAAFNNAPYAVPEVATNMDCPCSVAPLRVGHDYYLYGSSMQTYSPVSGFSSSWQGQVSAPSGHAVGSQLSAVNGVAGGPSTYTSGGDYYLLPVIVPVASGSSSSPTALVEYYAVFKVVSGHSNWGQLVNMPVQADAATTWTPDAGAGAAALTIKITK